MTSKNPLSFYTHRIVACAIFSSILGFAWDSWWHLAIGRDTPFEPPHFFILLSFFVAILLSLAAWRRTKSRLWKRQCISLCFLPVALVIDQIWHQIYGAEDLSSAFIALSPPHILLTVTLLMSMIFALPLIHHDENPRAQEFFGSLIFACMMAIGILCSVPFHPTYPFAVFGFWGAGVMTLFLMLAILGSSDWKSNFAGATLTVIVFLLFYDIALGAHQIGARVIMKPFATAPIWIFAFACLLPAVIVDLSKKYPLWLRGGVAGGVFSAILFGLSSGFFPVEFQYPFSDAIIATFTSILGGMLAGFIMDKFSHHALKLTKH